jgi:hypothetical protein
VSFDYQELREQAARWNELNQEERSNLELQARRAASEQDLLLQSRDFDPHAPGYGHYRLADARNGKVMAGGGSDGHAYTLTLVEVVDYLEGRKRA